MKLKTLLTSIGLGAGLMYFYDPQRGDRRRALLRDKVNSWTNNADDALDVAIQDLRNRSRGTLAEIAGRLSQEEIPDWVLEERVRANLGRTMRHSGSIDVRAMDGRIILSGPVLRSEQDDLLKTVRRTRGVRDVEDQTRVFDSPQDIPSLQGSLAEKRIEPEWRQSNWSPSMRLITGLGGGLLAAYGLTRKGLVGMTVGSAGLLVAARGVTNMDVRSMLGLGLGDNAIKVQKAINIFAPIDEVYRYWANFENFPRFMDHVKEVHHTDGQSHWKVAGPVGTSIEFDAITIRDIPNEVISWQTIPDSQIHHAGSVKFKENLDGSTRITVQMDYVPPAGAMGHAVAKLFGVDPRQAMNEDLVRLKSLLEEGETTAKSKKVSLRDVPPGPTA